MIRIDRLEASVYRYPLATPVQTSFGLMRDRPMVVVKLTGRDGVVGWGEIWCNFPSVGAEHRGVHRDVRAEELASARAERDGFIIL